MGFFVVDMDIKVGEHIAALEAWVNALASKLMDEKDRAKRNVIEAEIRAAQTALGHYQAALDLESTLGGTREYSSSRAESHPEVPAVA